MVNKLLSLIEDCIIEFIRDNNPGAFSEQYYNETGEVLTDSDTLVVGEDYYSRCLVMNVGKLKYTIKVTREED